MEKLTLNLIAHWTVDTTDPKKTPLILTLKMIFMQKIYAVVPSCWSNKSFQNLMLCSIWVLRIMEEETKLFLLSKAPHFKCQTYSNEQKIVLKNVSKKGPKILDHFFIIKLCLGQILFM